MVNIYYIYRMETLKQCTKCKQFKEKTEFSKHKLGKHGLRPRCKKCISEEGKQYRHKYNLYSKRDWRCHLTEDEKRIRRNQYTQAYYYRRKKRFGLTWFEWYNLSQTEKDNLFLQYPQGKPRLRSPLSQEQKHRNYLRHREKRKKDPIYNIQYNLRKRLNSAVKYGYKGGSAVKNLGCSIEEFKIYIEQQFQEGMNWNNHGEWHFDHIKPLSSFDLTNPEQVKKACHFTNIQPLWAFDNISKGNN